MVFLTGDLGFMALEPLAEAMGDRFINAGIAEQNMVSVAAAMAKEGLDPWVYSIAPFCYARPFEQIRNDVAFHRLSVKLIGNGGGYGYGVMGPTHHAIEDYGVLLTLPNMRVFVPTFDQDVPEAVARAGAYEGPSYLRLGRGEPPVGYDVPAYQPWRRLLDGEAGDMVVAGPLAGAYLSPLSELPSKQRPALWAVAELPLEANPMPDELVQRLAAGGALYVAEEHVKRGGLGSDLATIILESGLKIGSFRHMFAKAHHFKTYGSQHFMRAQAGLDPASMLEAIASTGRVST